MRSRINVVPIRSISQMVRLGLCDPSLDRQPLPSPTPVETLPCDLRTRWAMADELSPALQLVLLELRTTHIAKACAGKLRIEGVWICDADREQLKRAGLIITTEGLRRLTPQGQWKADDCARIVARKFNLHVVVRGGGYRAHTMQCSCGWSTQFTCSPSRKEATFDLHERRHLDQVGA